MNLINFFLSLFFLSLLFRVLLDSPAFAALANCWCRYGRIVCYRVGDLVDFGIERCNN